MSEAVRWTTLFFMICLYSGVYGFECPVMLRVECSGEHSVIQQLHEEGDVDVWRSEPTFAQVLVEQSSLQRVKRALHINSINHKVEVQDMMDLIKQENVYMNTRRKKRSAKRMDWDSYHDLETLEGYMGWLNATKNDLVNVIPIASTAEERRVYAVRVTDRSYTGPKKKIWVEGGIHAREWISPAATTYLLHQVATNKKWAPLLAKSEWYFVPVANPDGYSYSFTAPQNRLWRKNRRVVDENLPDRCKGIDLNRNWNTKWGVGSSKNPCSEVYRGAHPFSEPEAIGLGRVMESVKPIDMFLTIHSFGQSILHPPGWSKEAPSNIKDLRKLGKRFVDAVAQVSRGKTMYQLGGSGELYGLASGASDDYAYDALGTPFSYTIELRDKGTYGFMLPEAMIGETVRETAAGIYCMAGLLTDVGPCASNNTRRRNNNRVRFNNNL